MLIPSALSDSYSPHKTSLFSKLLARPLPPRSTFPHPITFPRHHNIPLPIPPTPHGSRRLQALACRFLIAPVIPRGLAARHPLQHADALSDATHACSPLQHRRYWLSIKTTRAECQQSKHYEMVGMFRLALTLSDR